MGSSMLRKPIRSIKSVLSTIRHSKTASLPFKLKFESSAVCNLKCKMCPLNIGLKRKQGVLKFDNFKYVFDQINPAYLNLTGIGEPLLNPDIFRIIKYGKSKNAMVKFDTNANLMNETNARKILDTKIDVLSISIDGTDKKTYESIRINGNFETMRTNVKRLVNLRNKMKSKTQIHMFFVLQKNNIDKLPDFIRFADELGVDYIAGSFVVTLGGNKNEINQLVNKSVRENLIRETEEAIKHAKVEVSIAPLLEYLKSSAGKKNYNSNKPCFMPWYSVFITWDGWVNPCDFSCDNEVVFGNAFNESFEKIWNNEKIKTFRMQLLKDRKKIALCRGCGVDESYIEKEFKKIPLVKHFQYHGK